GCDVQELGAQVAVHQLGETGGGTRRIDRGRGGEGRVGVHGHAPPHGVDVGGVHLPPGDGSRGRAVLRTVHRPGPPRSRVAVSGATSIRQNPAGGAPSVTTTAARTTAACVTATVCPTAAPPTGPAPTADPAPAA